MTLDRLGEVKLLSNFSSLALSALERRCLEDILTKDDSINESMDES